MRVLERALELGDPLVYQQHQQPMMLLRIFPSTSAKRVDDLHDFWNLHVSAAPEEEGTKAAIQGLETRLEMCVGVVKETDLQATERQSQGTRLSQR